MPSVLSVACGEYHTIVICTEGTLYSWGKNDMGQLGHGHKKSEHFPRQVNTCGCIRMDVVVVRDCRCHDGVVGGGQ